VPALRRATTAGPSCASAERARAARAAPARDHGASGTAGRRPWCVAPGARGRGRGAVRGRGGRAVALAGTHATGPLPPAPADAAPRPTPAFPRRASPPRTASPVRGRRAARAASGAESAGLASTAGCCACRCCRSSSSPTSRSTCCRTSCCARAPEQWAAEILFASLFVTLVLNGALVWWALLPLRALEATPGACRAGRPGARVPPLAARRPQHRAHRASRSTACSTGSRPTASACARSPRR
jgi:hypothetical protein